MGNAFLCRPLAFSALFSENSTSLGPATNLANDRLGRAWQATPSGGNVAVYAELPALTSIDTVALLATNISPTANWLVRFSDQPLASFGAGFLDINGSTAGPTASPHRQILAHVDAGPVMARSVLVLCDSASVFTAGRLVIGKSWKPAENLDFGWDFSVTDRGKSEASDLGLSSDRIGTKHQQFRWAWGFLTPTEARQTGLDLLAYAGRTRPVLFCADPEAADLHNVVGYGKLTEGGRVQQQFVDGYASSFQLDSDLILST